VTKASIQLDAVYLLNEFLDTAQVRVDQGIVLLLEDIPVDMGLGYDSYMRCCRCRWWETQIIGRHAAGPKCPICNDSDCV
jgi:hypothetical protein